MLGKALSGSTGSLSKRVIKADGGAPGLIAGGGGRRGRGGGILDSRLTGEDQPNSNGSQPVGSDPHWGGMSDILHITYLHYNSQQ